MLLRLLNIHDTQIIITITCILVRTQTEWHYVYLTPPFMTELLGPAVFDPGLYGAIN